MRPTAPASRGCSWARRAGSSFPAGTPADPPPPPGTQVHTHSRESAGGTPRVGVRGRECSLWDPPPLTPPDTRLPGAATRTVSGKSQLRSSPRKTDRRLQICQGRQRGGAASPGGSQGRGDAPWGPGPDGGVWWEPGVPVGTSGNHGGLCWFREGGKAPF